MMKQTIQQNGAYEQPEQSIQASTDGHGQPANQRDLELMTDLELQWTFQALSTEIEDLKLIDPLVIGSERLEWEARLLVAMYRRESVQFEQVYRSLDKLEQSLAIQKARQNALSMSLMN